MRAHLFVALALIPTAAFAKKPSAPKTPKVAASTAAAGADLPAYAASTETITVELVARRFAEVDSRMTSLRAGFKQFVHMDGSDTAQQVEGEVFFRKPDLMRLTHEIPEKQTVVADGTWLWVYRPSTNQVIQTRVEDWRKREPLAKGLLDFGKSADLLSRYDAVVSTVSAPGADGHRVFVVTLAPKAADKAGDGTDFKLQLRASTKNFFPYEASLRVGRAGIRSVFDPVRFNPELPDETFRFSPPAGADVFASPSAP